MTAWLLARRGWCVFPCFRDGDIVDGKPAAKRPFVKDWEHRACSDPERVARYWPGPRHNIGIACGPSRLVVLDLDTHGALPDDWRIPGIRDGRDVLAQLCEWAGQPWPSTYWVATPSGGWHFYFTAPDGSRIRNSASLLGPQIDVRAQGGYVVGAGSAVGGRPYELLDGRDPAPLPRWIHRMLGPAPELARPGFRPHRTPDPPARLAGLLHAVETAPEGQRNHVLHWAACRVSELLAVGEVDAIRSTEALVEAAAASGLPEREARRTVSSGMRGAS